MVSVQFKTKSRRKPSRKVVLEMRKAGRAPLVLGKRLKVDESGMKDLGLEYYYPSTDINNIENLFVYGQSGSGKTWGVMNLVGQSYFKERRSWVIVDSKGSYRKNHIPNDDYRRELAACGIRPRGIPEELMVVTAPEYYINGLSEAKIKADQITHSYRIPISIASIPILFEITKLQSNTQYAATYNMEWKKMLARTRRAPTKADLYSMLNNIAMNANSTIQRWSENLIDRIQAAEDLTLTENQFSPIGGSLLQAAYDHQPRWIVITFKHAENSGDPINLAIYAAVLEEIRRVTELTKDHDLDLRVGLCVDELQYYADKDKKDTVAFTQTKEAIYRWGRSNRLFRVWATQKNEHLDGLLQDDINDFKRTGTYQKVLNFFTIKDPGYCAYMDRQRQNAFDLNLPYLVPYVKTPPPQFKIVE
jgi:hypothetical protein